MCCLDTRRIAHSDVAVEEYHTGYTRQGEEDSRPVVEQMVVVEVVAVAVEVSQRFGVAPEVVAAVVGFVVPAAGVVVAVVFAVVVVAVVALVVVGSAELAVLVVVVVFAVVAFAVVVVAAMMLPILLHRWCSLLHH